MSSIRCPALNCSTQTRICGVALAFGVACVLCLLAVGSIGRPDPSPEQQAISTVEEIAAGRESLMQGMEDALAQLVLPGATIHIPGQPELVWGRSEIMAFVVALGTGYKRQDVNVVVESVHLDAGKVMAKVSGKVTTSQQSAKGKDIGNGKFSAELVRQEERWWLATLRIDPLPPAEPGVRPESG